MTLRLFNSLTRQLEDFDPIHDGEARVYTCGPTVYNYPHIGNMRAYVFADTLGRALEYAGYKPTHVINITDVGHLTDDADAGEDKLEKAAASTKQSIWDIAKHYTQAYWDDIKALNIRGPMKAGVPDPSHWSIATDHVPRMIDFAKTIAPKHCYELDSGLYFDTSTVPDYGRLARAHTEAGVSRIDPVPGKRNPADFAIWRKTPPGETRQMEWDSPWGRGAPGWHIECSVMSGALLGFPFDIHTGGIDHREIHHPCEIAQNQAHEGSSDTGARVWMHNNFLIDRTGKMSKSSGEFLRLQLLIDKGFHPLAYRMMCLQAHYRSELEFSWEGLAAAFTRLKRLIAARDRLGRNNLTEACQRELTDVEASRLSAIENSFYQAIYDDLNTSKALTVIESLLDAQLPSLVILATLTRFDGVLGLNLFPRQGGQQAVVTRKDLRIRPKSATLTEADIEAALEERKAARASRDFATSDRIRDHLIANGVEVMDGDPLGWDWKLDI